MARCPGCGRSVTTIGDCATCKARARTELEMLPNTATMAEIAAAQNRAFAILQRSGMADPENGQLVTDWANPTIQGITRAQALQSAGEYYKAGYFGSAHGDLRSAGIDPYSNQANAHFRSVAQSIPKPQFSWRHPFQSLGSSLHHKTLQVAAANPYARKQIIEGATRPWVIAKSSILPEARKSYPTQVATMEKRMRGEFPPMGSKIPVVGGLFRWAGQSKTGKYLKVGGRLEKTGIASRVLTAGFKAKVKQNIMEVSILFAAAFIVSVLFSAIYLGAALALAAFYLVLPTEYDILEKVEKKYRAKEDTVRTDPEFIRLQNELQVALRTRDANRINQAQGNMADFKEDKNLTVHVVEEKGERKEEE